MRSLNRAELIVILVLIAVFLAVAPPWFLSTREESRLQGCKNNLRQIGIGLANYADADKGLLPYGTVANRDLSPEDRLSWTVPLLGFLQAPVTHSFDLTKGWKAAANSGPGKDAIVAPRRMPLFHCPVDPIDTPPDELQFSSYVGLTGLGKDAAMLPVGDPSAGIFGYDRRSSLKKLAGNRESTVCVLEASRNNGPWIAGGPPTLRPFLPDETPFIGNGLQFGGHHAEGCATLMADFHVRVFSPKTDPGVFARLCTVGK